MKGRRILGSPNDSPDNVRKKVILDPQSPTPSHPKSNAIDDISEEIKCPICNEPMINMFQLNQHIDDIHVDGQPNKSIDTETKVSNTSYTSPTINKLINNDFIQKDMKKWFDTTPTKRKTISLDLFDGNKGFSLSGENNNDDSVLSGSEANTPKSTSSPLNKPRIIRSHWKHPSSNPQCKLCQKPLNVKHGIVHCRKCGELTCNDDSNYKVRLRNPHKNETIPQYDKNGIWSKCCRTCYFDKPDLKNQGQINMVDLTDKFKRMRTTNNETSQLNRDKLIKRFIKIINFLSEYYLTKKDSFLSFSLSEDQEIIDKQKQIIGFENWQDDDTINHCYICFTRFNFLVRKHHCRVCGKIVCDDKFEQRQGCSLLVPVPIVLKILSNLNYSKFVLDNWKKLMSNNDITIRMCKNCKNDLTYDFKLKSLENPEDTEESNNLKLIFLVYQQLLVVKNNINHYLPKYESQLLSPELKIDITNKLKDRIMIYLKDFESLIFQFKHKFYLRSGEINPVFSKNFKLINGINQSLILFLQDNLLKFKDLNEKFRNIENSLLPKETIDKPKLTKRQIRELREQLMVMNEQKFIIENMIYDITKQRKFDQLQPLLNNKQELVNEIESLEEKLGEFGF